MSFLNLQLMGGFGNQLFQYAFAKAYAEQAGLELCCGPWVGDQIFNLDHSPLRDGMQRVEEKQIVTHATFRGAKMYLGNVEIRSYFQQQAALIYTRQQVRKWFKFKPEVLHKLELWLVWPDDICAHRRVGDYPGYGYVVPSIASYEFAIHEFHLCFSPDKIVWVTEEKPGQCDHFQGSLSFLPDFYRLMQANTLLRANSTFSWWAATLGHGRVFSPVIEGLEGGKEQDVRFVEGNHPRFANLDFVTDLHLPE